MAEDEGLLKPEKNVRKCEKIANEFQSMLSSLLFSTQPTLETIAIDISSAISPHHHALMTEQFN